MAIDYAALATEINTDPLALGYAAPKAAGNDAAVATLLNTIGATAAYQVNREPISTAVFLSHVDSAGFLALLPTQLAQLQCLMVVQTIDINDASTQAILVGIFGNPSATRTNIIAILKRQGSRAEVLFGRGVTVSSDDVARAMGRV